MGKTKTITIYSTIYKSQRDEKITEYENKYPQFEIYKNLRQSRYNIKYEIKAKGTIEDIELYLNKTQNKKNEPIKKIIDLLKVELEPLRLMYIEKTKNWALGEFKRISKIANLTKEQLEEKYGKEFKGKNYLTGECIVKKYIDYNTRSWYETNKSVFKKGIEVFLEKTKNDAENHFQSSIVKLSERIQEKDMNIDNIKASTSYSTIDVNISTILTDNEKTVTAYTIIASGPIQKPHYRYLVK